MTEQLLRKAADLAEGEGTPVALALAVWLRAEAQEVELGWRRTTTAPALALANALLAAPARERLGHVVLVRDPAGRLQPTWDGELHTDRDAAVAELAAAGSAGEEPVLGEVVADRG